jgi:hypothetical protein
MATVVKDFKIKSGLVVEGSTGTINGKSIITAGISDAKGDLIVGSADDAVARLGVGTNGQVLTAASGATYGVQWSDPAAVGVFTESIVFEGATANDYETTLAVTDPTADRTITLPNATGTVALTSDITTAVDAITTSVIEEGTNEYFTVERAQDAVGNAVGTGLTYNDSTGAISVTANTFDAFGSASTVAGNLATHESDTSTHGVAVAIVGTTDTQTLTNKTLTSPKINEDVVLTATATELNVLDGITSSTAELNILDGVTATAAELNILDGVTSTAAELNILDGVTSTAAELNILDGATLTVTELNYVDGVTSAIQTQLDGKLDESGGTMTGAIAMGTNKITGLGTPTDATDAATKAYVDSAAQGIDWKASVRAATTAAVTLASNLEAGDVIDGVTLVAGNRILVKNQATASENGLYVVQASGAPTRSTDADADAEVTSNFAVFVEEGTLNADQGYVLTNNGAITVGTTELVFTQFTGLGQITAGTGLDKTGNTIDIDSTVATLTGTQTFTNKTLTSPKINEDVVLTATATELNVLDGITSSTAELNILDGVTSTAAELNILDGATLTTTELNYVDGVTSAIQTQLDNKSTASKTETLTNKTINTASNDITVVAADISDVTASAAELNILDGATLTVTELNYVDGVTSAIQTQLDAKATPANITTAIDALTTTAIEEGTNSYFTDARAKTSAAELLTGATKTNITITGNGSGLTITAENGVADSTTTDLAEGTNLYFTNARAVTALEAVVPDFDAVEINSVAKQVAATLSAPTAGIQTAHAFAKADYRSAEYLVKVAYGTHTEISKVLLTLDTSDNIAITEYGIVGTNGSASTISAGISGSNVQLLVTTANNSSTVTVVGTLLA